MIDTILLDDFTEEIDTDCSYQFIVEELMAKSPDSDVRLSRIEQRLNSVEKDASSVERSILSIREGISAVEKEISNVNGFAKGFWIAITIAGFLVVAIFGWSIHKVGQLDDKFQQLDVKVGKIQEKLADGGLGQIVASLLSKPLGDQRQAEKSLTVAATILKSVKTGAAPAEQDDIKTIAKGISNAQMNFPTAPQVWDASAAFISYRSRTTESAKALIERAADKKNCSYSWGKPSPSEEVFKNCEVSLEEVANNFKDVKIGTIPSLPPKTSLMPRVFYDSVIHYHGGELPDGPMYFYNCVFLFDVQDVPANRGTQTLEALTNLGNLSAVHIGE
jgi:hypothetical protein